MSDLRPTAFVLTVLTVAFVFVASAFLVPQVAAQSSGSVSGSVCLKSPYEDYPRPADDSSGSASCAYYGQGLAGATVRLTKAPPIAGLPVGAVDQSKTTDDNGFYQFSGLAAGNYTLLVQRTGFEDAQASIAIADGAAARQDFALAGKSVSVPGRVASDAGAAIVGAELQFYGDSASANAISGADGRFTVQLTSGWYSISVQAQDFQSYGDYRLLDGSEQQIVLSPIPPRDATIHGVVRDQDGNPVERVRIAAYTYGGCSYASAEPSSGQEPASTSIAPCESRPYYGGETFAFSGADGSYELGVYSGDGSLSVQKDGYASYSMQIHVASGEDQAKDLSVKKFPEKTAHIVGKVSHDGKGVRGAYVNVNSPEFGIYECSAQVSDGGSSGSSGSGSAGSPETKVASSSYYYDPGCSITIHDDGTFEGTVTPGYSIVSVWVDSYRECAESRDSDGSYSSSCGPEYYSWSKSLVLPAEQETRLDIVLRQRPAPDAIVSGYLIDAESGKAIPGAQISFSNADTYGYGYAMTDEDGSYKLRLRSGYHTVSAYAEGHLHWEGTLDIAKGDTPFDVKLTPGQESYGYCCGPYYATGDGVMTKEASGSSTPPSMVPQADGGEDVALGSQDEQSGEQYEDLGGGLGPYDADERSRELSGGSNGSPGPGAVLLLAGLAAALVVARRRAA